MNPATKQRELTTIGDAKAERIHQSLSKRAKEMSRKKTNLNAQMQTNLQLNTSRFKNAIERRIGFCCPSWTWPRCRTIPLRPTGAGRFTTNRSECRPWSSMIEQGGKASDWNRLSADKQDAVMGALRMKNSALLFQKVGRGMGRASKEAMDIEISNMPSPIEGATVGNKKLDAFQENIDQMAARSVKLPWMDQPQDVKARIEQQGVDNYNRAQAAKPQGKYRASGSMRMARTFKFQTRLDEPRETRLQRRNF